MKARSAMERAGAADPCPVLRAPAGLASDEPDPAQLNNLGGAHLSRDV